MGCYYGTVDMSVSFRPGLFAKLKIFQPEEKKDQDFLKIYQNGMNILKITAEEWSIAPLQGYKVEPRIQN